MPQAPTIMIGEKAAAMSPLGAIAEDHIVEMSTEDADCLIHAGWTLLTE